MLTVIRKKCMKTAERLLTGEVTLKKTNLWIAALICTLLGVLIGLINAPLTHGITIWCGNNNGNTNYFDEEQDGDDGEE